MIKNYKNTEGHQNRITGSKVTAILLKGWILPNGEVASVHPSLKGFSTPWVRDQESRQHPNLLDTKPDNVRAAVLNLYGSFLSSGTQ